MSKTKTILIDDSKPREEKKTKKAPVAQTVPVEPSLKSPKTEKVRASLAERESRRGKKYQAAKAKINSEKIYAPAEAIQLAKETSFSKFPGSVELHVVLTRGSVNKLLDLPFSSGKAKRVEIASDETVAKLKAGKIDFDVLIATPAAMPKLVPFARILGPKGLMPNPKNGTISEKPEEAAKKFGVNSLSVKSETKAPLVHTVIGKVNQPEKELLENLGVIVSAIGPKNIERAYLAPAMGPSVKLLITA
ncbi:MAG: hypothetical protein A3E16_03995 [Candidatus Blackburnbacteria bacterium RIFCSPHIGHO2_12_FULL_44_25]|nr:MAG: hypothetical protein A3E16_03995 [Candidatus Blackburnbacteria bacterium RIFCSPHIGHO2_12_FULL_44_25]